LVIYVLDQSLYHERVSDTRYTFEDCHLWPLRFPNRQKPFLRILAAHCRTFNDAYRLKMIDYCGRSGNISLYTRRASRPYMMPNIPLSIL